MKRVEEITKTNHIPFVDVHPTPGAGRSLHGRDLPARHGSDGRESKYRRCVQCGFIINTDRTHRGSGRGNEQAVLKTGETAIYNDVTVMAGCQFCGSSEF